MDTPKNIYLLLKSKFISVSPSILNNTLDSLPENSTVVFDGSNTNEFDKEALSLIYQFRKNALIKKVQVYFIKIPELVI